MRLCVCVFSFSFKSCCHVFDTKLSISRALGSNQPRVDVSCRVLPVIFILVFVLILRRNRYLG